MNLTPEQQAVVDISNGRHLVLAPPGSGKTEMLTQRVIEELKALMNSSFVNAEKSAWGRIWRLAK